MIDKINNDKKKIIKNYSNKDKIVKKGMSRRPKNKAEGEFYDLMMAQGWEVTKRGWPDYICFKDNRFIVVEVKGRRSHRLRYQQRRIMMLLADYNVQCYRWSAEERRFDKICGKSATA